MRQGDEMKRCEKCGGIMTQASIISRFGVDVECKECDIMETIHLIEFSKIEEQRRKQMLVQNK